MELISNSNIDKKFKEELINANKNNKSINTNDEKGNAKIKTFHK